MKNRAAVCEAAQFNFCHKSFCTETLSHPGQSKIAIAVFNDSRAVLNPVTGIAVGDAIDFDVLRCVNVATDYAVASSMTGVPNYLIAIMADVSSDRTKTAFHPCHE